MNAQPTPRTPAIDITNLHVTYRGKKRDTHAVRGVTMHVAPGESVALVGESGSGKTSIARTVLGLLSSQARIDGQVRIAGQDITALRPAHARTLRGRTIGYVPQDPGNSLNPLRTIIDQVMEPLHIHNIGQPRERRDLALQALRDAGIPNPEQLAQRWPHQLSGGQKQRVLIAAAIVTTPQVIVADEPTSALDVTVQKVILDKLQDISRTHHTAVLLITHDLAVAAARTQRLYAMKDGVIAESGPSRTVLSAPTHDYTARLVSAIPGRRPRAVKPRPSAAPDSTDASGLPLQVSAVSKVFGKGAHAVTALDAVSFHLAPGSSVGIVGESGSGKTTLARLALGLTAADAGTTLVYGHDMRRPTRAVRRRIQPVFQNPHTSFDPMRSIGSSILEPARGLRHSSIRGRSARRTRVSELMSSVGLEPHLAERKPWELSGGQLQRAAIARALSVDPDLMILDEAVSALDVTVQATILELLTRLRDERGLSLAFITHDLAVVRELCHEVAVMKDGTIVERGATETVFTAPAHPYTRRLIDAIENPWV